jgi:hypothetical protein
MSNLFAALVLASVVAAAPVIRTHSPARTTAPVVVAATALAAEPHPKIRAAIGALKAAKAELQAAAHDFKGHRVDAIQAIDQAIAQLNLALQSDR